MKIASPGGTRGIAPFLADMITKNEYYPFGMLIDGQSVSSGNYRYGYNGKENDNEAKGGAGKQIDYGARIYDSRVARFLSQDPLKKEYPQDSPFMYAGNNPIMNIDYLGLAKFTYYVKMKEDGSHSIFKVSKDESVRKNSKTILIVPVIADIADFIIYNKDGKLEKTIKNVELKNFGNSVYIGPDNPQDANEEDIYSIPPINSLDAAAKRHDLSYDIALAKGADGMFFNLQTLDADIALVKEAISVMKMYQSGSNDPITNEKVSPLTFSTATAVAISFSAMAAQKAVRVPIEKGYDKIIDDMNTQISNLSNSATIIKGP